jgi:lipid-A-disaccharide synthase
MALSKEHAIRVGIVAGEASGDILGAGLIRALREVFPQMVVEGIGGPLMMAEGCASLFPQDRLAVMGIIEPLKRLPELLHIRRSLRAHFLDNPPDVFIGIDSPDFNLQLEYTLKQAGIKTVHYVSPSVWAWRQGRLKTIAKATDLILTLFPFEERFYRQQTQAYPSLHAVCVGHSLADSIPMVTDTQAARDVLHLPTDKPVIAILPGSRAGEVERMGRLFLDVARQCWQQDSNLMFVLPAANEAREQQLKNLLLEYKDVPVHLVSGQSQACMAASDVVLMASGTTTLEAMLLKKPMVVAYKLAALSYALISRLLKVPYVALPNLLAGELLVPEFLQSAATVDNLSHELLAIIKSVDRKQMLVKRFTDLHYDLKRNADKAAATAVIALLETV